MYKNTSYTLRALVLGTLLAATGLGFASANTTTTTNAPTTTIESTKAESTLQAPTVGSAKAAPSNVNVAKAEASTKGNTCSCKQIYWYSARYPKDSRPHLHRCT